VELLNLESSNFVRRWAATSVSLGWQTTPKRSMVRATWLFFNFWALIIYWEWVKQGTSNFGMHSEHASAHAW